MFSVGTDATMTYEVEWTQDLQNWTLLKRFLPKDQVDRTIRAVDPGAAGEGTRIYRAVEL